MAGCLLLNIMLKVSVRPIRQEDEIKGIKMKGKGKVVLLVEDMISYLEVPQNSSRKLLDMINTFSKVMDMKTSSVSASVVNMLRVTS